MLLLCRNQMGNHKCFSLQKQIQTNKFPWKFICVRAPYKLLFIGPYISCLHLKNMHYLWRMNITNQTGILLFVQFSRKILFSTQTQVIFMFKSTITGNIYEIIFKGYSKQGEYMDSLFSPTC